MNHTYNYLKKAYQKVCDLLKRPEVFVYLLSAIAVTIPLKFAYGNSACFLFLIVSFSKYNKTNFSDKKALLLPIGLYVFMFLSLFWTRDLQLTKAGLQKEIFFLLMPLAFLAIPKLSRERVCRIFKIYSFGMVFYALYYYLNAILKYISARDTGVFFYHELVTIELNAIYVSVFASLALFYFIAKKNKSSIELLSILILTILIFLLSSKNIIFVDFLLTIIFYFYFAEVSKKAKFFSILGITFFLIFSVLFVKKVRDRFLIEYETVFIDNTINKNIGNEKEKVCNISLKQAWCNDKFEQNNFFPGTALRLFQIRIFKEMLQEQNILFTGFGLGASQDKIREKIVQHNLYEGYGKLNFHNQYVQIFAELGLFGFLILIVMLFVNIKNAICHKNFLHIVFSVTMIVLFLTESFFCRQRGIIFFILIYCMFNAMENPKEKIN